MGAVRKWSGVQSQIEATNRNAAAQEKAIVESSQQAQDDLIARAKAAADQQAMLSQRAIAEAAASEVVSQPLATADVQLVADATESATATRRKRRASFGKNYSTGVTV